MKSNRLAANYDIITTLHRAKQMPVESSIGTYIAVIDYRAIYAYDFKPNCITVLWDFK